MKKILIISGMIAAVSMGPFDSARAEEGDAGVKLNQVLANQEQILKELETIKEELHIVKIRATNR